MREPIYRTLLLVCMIAGFWMIGFGFIDRGYGLGAIAGAILMGSSMISYAIGANRWLSTK